MNPCLIKEEIRTKLILEVVPLPELHLLMGFVNHLSTYISTLWPEYTKWVSSLGCIRRGYHGGTYEGNACQTILQNCDQLSLLLPNHLLPLLEPMRYFNKLVHGTFGNVLDPNYPTLISGFQKSYSQAQEYCAEVM